MIGFKKRNENVFELGQAYWANPCMRGACREIVVPVSREDGVITFAIIDDLVNGHVDRTELSGEFVKIEGPDMTYTVSSRMTVPAEEAAEVLEVVRSRQHA